MALKDKLRNIQEQERQGKHMLEESKNRWVQDCNEMMDNIKQWISGYVIDGLASVNTQPLSIQEEHVDQYTVSQHSIDFMGRGFVSIKPIGTFLIGASGRIDVTVQARKGPASTFMLIRYKKSDEEYEWKIVEKQGQQREEIDFTIENLETQIEKFLEL